MRTQLTLPPALIMGIAALIAAFVQPPPKKAATRGAITTHAEMESSLLGMWNATQPEKEGDMVRFYYFHKGNIGLIRYGRLGLSYTKVFHWQVHPSNKLALTFTKTGDLHHVTYRLDATKAELHFAHDPVFSGAQTYRKRAHQRTYPNPLEQKTDPFARIWIHETKARNQTRAFRMYQLQPPTIDGRGVGWFHEGDMTEWSTETLTYRRTHQRFTLDFPIRNERHSTSIELAGEGSNRTLTIYDDPRNFWHQRTYRDGGPGFTSMLQGEPFPYHMPNR